VSEFHREIARTRQTDQVALVRRRQLLHQSRLDRPGPRRPALPRQLWLVVVGMFINYLGYGAILPFEVIYLHTGRGFSLLVSGVVVSLITGVAVLCAPPAGPLIDRFGARAVAAVGAAALAAGYGGLAFAPTPLTALAAASVAGAGNGALNPAQSALVAALTPADLRHRATAVGRVAANLGAAIGGGLGGLVAAYGLSGFILLFLANAATYLGYVGLLLIVVRHNLRPDPVPGGYRTVLRDRAFLGLLGLNVAVIAVGWGAFTWLVPPYAAGSLGLSAQLVGLLLLANAGAVAAAQVPVARFAEGRRRMVMTATAAGLFVLACLLVLGAGAGSVPVYPALLVAVILVGVGECFHTAVLMPLTADLAPAGIRGRYMAAMGLSWWTGLALAPLVGVPLLGVWSTATFLVPTGIALAAAVGALRWERRLPAAVRLTPRPRPPAAVPARPAD
jgi:MFS family permease